MTWILIRSTNNPRLLLGWTTQPILVARPRSALLKLRSPGIVLIALAACALLPAALLAGDLVLELPLPDLAVVDIGLEDR